MNFTDALAAGLIAFCAGMGTSMGQDFKRWLFEAAKKIKQKLARNHKHG